MDKPESIRLHMDWWGKCRTCRHWQGTDGERGEPRWNPGPCTNSESPLFNQETWTEGHCEKWDSFDIDTALGMMEKGLEHEINQGNTYELTKIEFYL